MHKRSTMIVIALTISTILAFAITGCGNSGNSAVLRESKISTEQNHEQDYNQDREDPSWQADYSPLENRYELAVISDNIYGCYVKDDQVLLDSISKENLSINDTFVLADASSVSGMAADNAGNVYLLGNKEEDTGLWKVDSGGNLQDFVKIELKFTKDAINILLKGIYTDQNGYLYIWCEMLVPETEIINGIEGEVWHDEDRVYITDEHLNALYYVHIAEEVLSFQMNSEGTPLFLVKDEEGIYIQEIDMDKGDLKGKVRLDKLADSFDMDHIYSLENIVPIDNGCLYCQGSGLYELNYDTQKSEKVFSLSAYGIFSSDLLFLSKNGDTIEVIDNHGDAEYSEYIAFAMGGAEKQTVTLGTTSTLQNLEQVVTEFNRYNSEYRVEIVDYYSQEGNYDDGMEQLKLDVVTGKAPDIIEVTGIDYNMFSEKGVLADLYEFMQGDEECSKSMLVQSVAEAYEDGGHLYSIAPAFQLHTMWGYGDVTEGRSGVTFHELFRLLENSGKDLNAISGFYADESVLTTLCTVSMDEFVDWENGTCDFEGEYFKEVLTFAKEYTGNYTGGTYIERIHSREVVMSIGIISGVTDYQIQEELYGGNIGFIGYPVAEGSGTAIAFRGSEIAINANQENQAGAWEFAKFYLLKGYDGQGFPIVQQQFDRVMEAAMEDDYGTAEDGSTERYPKDSYYDYAGDEWILVYAATQAQVDAVVQLVESACNRAEPHWAIQNIINEEAAAYFAGQADLDRTVEKIQNRVSLLLQESM